MCCMHAMRRVGPDRGTPCGICSGSGTVRLRSPRSVAVFYADFFYYAATSRVRSWLRSRPCSCRRSTSRICFAAIRVATRCPIAELRRGVHVFAARLEGPLIEYVGLDVDDEPTGGQIVHFFCDPAQRNRRRKESRRDVGTSATKLGSLE
jgi:hypothetical protein